MIIALASPRVAISIEQALERIQIQIAEASRQGAKIVCFPEAYVPGLRGLDIEVPPFGEAEQDHVLSAVSQTAWENQIAVIVGMECLINDGRQIAAAVFDANGTMLGIQTKNQLDPTEEQHYVPGQSRQIFQIPGLTFGVAICHEAFRYPETVRWAAVRGAQIVFHPHCTGSDFEECPLLPWGSPHAPYYEKAMMCRALENTIYFASVNYAFRYQHSASSVISPTGECLAHLPYGQEGVLVFDIDLDRATGLLASRFASERYQDQPRDSQTSVRPTT